VLTVSSNEEAKMNARTLVLTVVSLVLGTTSVVNAFAAGEPLPAWAYPWAPEINLPVDDGVTRRVPGSTAAYSVTQINDLFAAVVWHPADHPALPGVVAQGRKPDLRACGSCHRADGAGGPENASLAGLSAAYIAQQLLDFRSGARKFSGPQRGPSLFMVAVAKAMTDEDIRIASDYFAALKLKPAYTVVEAATVPKTWVNRNFATRSPGSETEALGHRIVEIPADEAQFEHRDPRSKFIAYVQPGSIAKGEALVKTGSAGGAGTTMACATCHGADLKGIGPIPGIAGRSPSYIVRQLYDIQQGTRAGVMSALMKPIIEKLAGDDMNAIAAYLAAQQP
jgi:cytochrome c553